MKNSNKNSTKVQIINNSHAKLKNLEQKKILKKNKWHAYIIYHVYSYLFLFKRVKEIERINNVNST